MSRGVVCVMSIAGRDVTLTPDKTRTTVHVNLEGGGEGDVPFDMLVAALETVHSRASCPVCGEGVLDRLDFLTPSAPVLVCSDCDATCVMECTDDGFIPRPKT